MEGGIYNAEQLAQMAMENAKDIAGLKADVASAHRRINENDRLTEGIHQLAENVATMSLEIKMLTEKFDNSIERMENDLKTQAERITTIEKNPFKKWDKFIWLVIAAVVSVGINLLAGRFF